MEFNTWDKAAKQILSCTCYSSIINANITLP